MNAQTSLPFVGAFWRRLRGYMSRDVAPAGALFEAQPPIARGCAPRCLWLGVARPCERQPRTPEALEQIAERWMQRDAKRHDLPSGVEQGGARWFEAVCTRWDKQLRLAHARDVARVELSELLGAFFGGDDLAGSLSLYRSRCLRATHCGSRCAAVFGYEGLTVSRRSRAASGAPRLAGRESSWLR